MVRSSAGCWSTSCFDEEKPDDGKLCLVCEGSDPICEGDVDEENGGTYSKDDLEFAKALAEAFAFECTLD